MKDKYLIIVLTAIAVFLLLITLKLYEPREVNAALFSGSPTYGDLKDIRNYDGEDRSTAKKNLLRKIPLVRVYGGHVSVD